ncbi:MAG: 4Fe-4S dicluster domain-containing protein [Terriglobia bacterium]|jgi:formate hydrogenlyase subunit 6/NADH:ubiquinone oxidoreductase subunit I
MADQGKEAVPEERSLSLDEEVVVERDNFQALFDALVARAYTVLGPTLRDGAIVYDELKSAADLPAGWTDAQDGGTYRLSQRQDGALFGYAVGPYAWKKFLYPPVVRLWQAQRTKGAFQVTEEENHDAQKMAFIGVRSCELNAIGIQDKVFLGGAYLDRDYKSRREKTFIVAINCAQAGGTCFCVSMNTGPKVSSGFDIALTEVIENGRHYFVAKAGTETGHEILGAIPSRPASEAERAAARHIVESTAAQMGRSLDTTDIKGLLYRNYEHRRWDNVAARCLACANCTMVCPTCFCTTVEDVTDLTGEHAERWRKWDSCFTADFSYIHGGSIRATPRARYRQWMTHKLATWIDQFGTSGCVGCGRCITWCPVAIDITEEVRAIRETEAVTVSQKGNDNGDS